MNKIILIGRLTADPEISYSKKDPPVTIARYSIAVDKRQKRDDDIRVDYFQLVALGRTGEFAEKYLRKGDEDRGNRACPDRQVYQQRWRENAIL